MDSCKDKYKQAKLLSSSLNAAFSWHSYVKVKSGTITVLLKIVLNKGTSDGSFVNLNPIFTIFSILVNYDIVHMSHHFGCQRNRFIVKLHMYVLPQLPNYYIIKLCWCRSNAWCTPLCDTLLDFGCYGNILAGNYVLPCNVLTQRHVTLLWLDVISIYLIVNVEACFCLK